MRNIVKLYGYTFMYSYRKGKAFRVEVAPYAAGYNNWNYIRVRARIDYFDGKQHSQWGVE